VLETMAETHFILISITVPDPSASPVFKKPALSFRRPVDFLVNTYCDAGAKDDSHPLHNRAPQDRGTLRIGKEADMQTLTLPSQETAAARLLRDIAEAGTLFPHRPELDAALVAADALANLGWRVHAEFSPARHCRGPQHPDFGYIGLAIDNANFFSWCDSAEGQSWLADVPAAAPNETGAAA
jgi:hypothetical protein